MYTDPVLKAKADFLLGKGWKRDLPHSSQPGQHNFYKQYPTPTRCRCNDKPGIQLYLTLYEGRAYMDTDEIAASVELRGELCDKSWAKLQRYCLPQDLACVDYVVDSLLKAWEAINEDQDACKT